MSGDAETADPQSPDAWPEEERAARLAGWTPELGPLPAGHTLPVEPLLAMTSQDSAELMAAIAEQAAT